MKWTRSILVCILVFGSLLGCKKFLEEEAFSQLATENFLATQEGIESTLAGAYASAANMLTNNSIYTLGPQEFSTDIMWQSGDNVESTIAQYINFTLTPSTDFLTTNYDPPYQTIRNANILLENIDRVAISDQQKEAYKAECRFLRAVSYYKLYFFFGTVPLRKATTDELNMPRATDAEMKAFIESELLAVVPTLPAPGKEAAYGRAHSAAAQGFLCKYYLYTKQWQKAADMAKKIMDLNTYSLFATYKDLFKVENERNKEYIWIRPAKASADRRTANGWMNVSFPANFAKEPISGLTFLSTWVNFPNEFRLLDPFYNSFEAGDARKDLIITSYIDNTGKTISLLNDNNTRSFKYWPDPQASGASHGNDIPEIRYADILLSRSEALNELNGPNQEAVDLINQVRTRAKLNRKLLTDFPSKESLRDHILKERGWEFYSEGHRRMDLIRMDKYISSAQARGKTSAQPFHVLFPIPQVAINANPKLVQNPGY
ncbi:MAG: RagB/SusD family nutrient uptake outer membrane protein [Williamsia sp.]|nr:RagB/SusD family nutrient uptake outer membrane protein [Williamsia sp.]